MISCCVGMSDITHLNTCLFSAPVSTPLSSSYGIISRKGACWQKNDKKPSHTQRYQKRMLKCGNGFKSRGLSGVWLTLRVKIASYQTLLNGSCDRGHSLLCVCSCGFLLLGQSELAGTWCHADRGWPLVSGSSATPPPASLPPPLHILPCGFGINCKYK